MPRLATIRLVAAKELREALRDKRTLFVALVLPVLLYPLMMLSVGPLVSMQKRKLLEAAQHVAVTGPGATALERLVLRPPEEGRPGAGLEVVPSDDPDRDLREGRIALWIETVAGFEAALEEDRTAHVIVHRDGTDDRSLAAWQKWSDALEAAEEAELARRLQRLGVSSEWRDPIDAGPPVDVASPERRAAYIFGKMLAFVLVVLTLSGSFYPAVDAVAGEKERGTMETLLVAPCARTELVLGKFSAVLCVTLAAAVLNLTSMALTLGPFVGVTGIEGLAGLSVTPTVVAGILLLLVPLAALFSAVSLALSTLARSVKEAQHYMTPAFLVVMPLAMVVMIPNVPLTPLLAAVPVTNAVLFFRDLLLDRADVSTTLLVLVTTFGAAALALWGCVTLFLREETLFRGPEGAAPLLARGAPRERPGAGAAVFLFATSLALVWYGQSWLPTDITQNVLATQLLIVLAPCAVLAWWLRVDLRATFRLRAPRWGALALAVPLGIAAPVVNSALHRWFGVEVPVEGPFHEFEKALEAALGAHSPVVLALLFGLLPAVCEELTYRGFILSGFETSFSGRRVLLRAAVASAVFFALFHLFPERWGPTFLMGLLLAIVTLRSGSLLPAIVVHALNNTTLVLAPRLEGTFLVAGFDPDARGHAIVVALAIVIVAGVLGLLFLRRRRSA